MAHRARAPLSAMLLALAVSAPARAQQLGPVLLGIPDLVFDLKTEIGGGSLCGIPEPVRPLSGPPPGEISTSTSRALGSVLLGLGGDVLFMLPSAAVGIRGSAATALWNGYVFSLGVEGGLVLKSGPVKWMFFAEVGAEALAGVGGSAFTNGTPVTTWLPQAGGSLRLSFLGWMGTRPVFELWGRGTWWRHDEHFFQSTPTILIVPGTQQDVTVAVGGYMIGFSFGFSTDT